MTEETIKLADGRLLGYAIYGPASGNPVWYFHGTPSSRKEPMLLNAYGISLNKLLIQKKVKLIAVDRPGMGLSDYDPAGNFISFSRDVAQLKRHLMIGSCPVLCWSGGGPYGLAIASELPDQITGVFILCGFSCRFNDEVLRSMGANKTYFNAARYAPWILDLIMNLVSRFKMNLVLPQKLTGLADVDYQLLNDAVHFKKLTDYTLKEACRKGARGPIHEARMYYNYFGFRLSDVIPPVHYWWGTEDKAVVKSHAVAVEAQVPHSNLYYYPGEGHFSVFLKYFEEALVKISRLTT